MTMESGYNQYLERVLPAFERYYSISRENVPSPFVCYAEFVSHSEQYILVKAAKIAEIDSNEYVYFAECDFFTEEKLNEYKNTAWNNGVEKVHPYNGHRNSDITVIVFAKNVTEETKKQIKKNKLSKSYKWGFYGWSNFKLAVVNISDGNVYTNRGGQDYKKVLKNCLK